MDIKGGRDGRRTKVRREGGIEGGSLRKRNGGRNEERTDGGRAEGSEGRM